MSIKLSAPQIGKTREKLASVGCPKSNNLDLQGVGGEFINSVASTCNNLRQGMCSVLGATCPLNKGIKFVTIPTKGGMSDVSISIVS